MIIFSNFLERKYTLPLWHFVYYTFSGRLIHYNWLCAMSFSRIYVNEKIHQIHQTKKNNNSRKYIWILLWLNLCTVYALLNTLKIETTEKILLLALFRNHLELFPILTKKHYIIIFPNWSFFCWHLTKIYYKILFMNKYIYRWCRLMNSREVFFFNE